MTLHDRKLIALAGKPRIPNRVFWRKQLMHRRIALEIQWRQLFPCHPFSDPLPLMRRRNWNEEAWARAARAYHEERKSKKGNSL
jgi:hypothetical protein